MFKHVHASSMKHCIVKCDTSEERASKLLIFISSLFLPLTLFRTVEFGSAVALGVLVYHKRTQGIQTTKICFKKDKNGCSSILDGT